VEWKFGIESPAILENQSVPCKERGGGGETELLGEGEKRMEPMVKDPLD